ESREPSSLKLLRLSHQVFPPYESSMKEVPEMNKSMNRRLIGGAAAVAAGAVMLAGCAAAEPAGEFDPDAKVSLDFAFWGNDDRADRYNQLIEALNEEHPNITIKTTFTDFPSYWEKRATEAAGG